MKKHLLIIFTFLLCAQWLQAQTYYELSTLAGSGVCGSNNGSGSGASFAKPSGMAIDKFGNVYVTENFGIRVRKITPAGVVSTFADSLYNPEYVNTYRNYSEEKAMAGIAIDTLGNLYVAGTPGHTIFKITPNGKKSVFAGHGYPGSASGTGFFAAFNYPRDITIDKYQNLYVADGDNLIRKITPQGVVTLYSSCTRFPYGLVVDPNGNLFYTDNICNIYEITQDGHESVYAGSGYVGSDNGPGLSARFNAPTGLAIDASGNLYVSDSRNAKIRKITPNKDVSDFESGIALPIGIKIDASSGNFHVVSYYSNIIHKITPHTPVPPVVNYLDLPSSVCLGSTLNKTPTVTGSQVGYSFDHVEIPTNPVKDVRKGVNNTFFVLYAGDSIVQYTVTGTRIMRYDGNGTLSNIRKIAVDTSNRVYAWANGINQNAIHRIGKDGYVEFGTFVTPDNYFSSVTAMEIGFDGFLYVADDLNGYISKVDPADASVSSFAAEQGVSSISFGRKEMYIFKASEQKVYSSDLSAVNFTQVFQGLDTLNLQLDAFVYDTLGFVGMESFFVSSKTKNKVVRFIDYGNGYDIQMQQNGPVIDYTFLQAINQPLAVTHLANGNAEAIWVVTGDNQLISIAIYSYKISPALPKGLSFDIIKGTIRGTPLETSPATTYTIEIKSDLYGSSTHTFNFSVDATSPINNSTGTAISKNVQTDGLKINYFDINNCAEIMEIADKKGGKVMGSSLVQQEVLPILASFASGSFVRRVTEVNAQDPNAEARIKLYFTNDDINHYNSTNGPSDIDLDNNTTRGTMPVAILQLHKNENGVTEQIKHSPITANWDATKQLWIVDFEVTKFSTFYMGTSSSIDGFDCSSTGPTTTVTSCGYYFWRERVLTATGIYKDTTTNKFGCDSILTLDLTVTNDFEITQDNLFPEYLYCNTTDADSYQWMNCDNGGTIIDGATGNTFTAAYNGSYAVIATKNGCTDTSSCVSVLNLQPQVTGVTKGNVLETLSVYPNPGTGIYRIESVDHYRITVRSALGEVIMEEEVNGANTDIDLSAYPGGIYHLTIQTETSAKTVKLIKN